MSALLTSKHVGTQTDILFDFKNDKATVRRICLSFFSPSWMLYMENFILKVFILCFSVGLHVVIFNCKPSTFSFPQVCLKYYEHEFVELACQCPAVVCCRCSPTQKAHIVKLLQHHTGKRTCAIGNSWHNPPSKSCNKCNQQVAPGRNSWNRTRETSLPTFINSQVLHSCGTKMTFHEKGVLIFSILQESLDYWSN